MVKILALVADRGSNYHRVVVPLDLLDKDKYEVTYLNEKFFIEKIVKDFNYIYIYGIQMTHCVYLSLWREKYGFKIIQDVDDYWVLPINHYLKERFEKFKQKLFDQLILADIVLCSTPFLLERCLQFNVNCKLRENYIPIGYNQFKPELHLVKNRKIKVGICGSLSHLDDWFSIKNQLNRILGDEHLLENYEFIIAGYANDNKPTKEKWDKIATLFQGKAKLIKYLPVTEYVNLYNELDIVLAPLEINDFNRSKSSLKILESSIKSTIVISGELYLEKEINSYLVVDKNNSYFTYLKKLINRDYLNELKIKFQNKNLELNKQLQLQYKLESLLK